MEGVAFDPRVAPSWTDDTGDAITGTVGTAIADVTVPEVDAGTPDPTYAAVGSLPAGVSFDTTTRVLSFDESAIEVGSGTIRIRATNSAGTDDWTVAYTFAAALPDVDAPTVTIDTVAAGNENTMVQLGATVSGGTYDTIEYAWTVSGGMLDDSTSATPTWMRPEVTADQQFTIGLTVTARGTGTVAADGTSDTATAAAVMATVRNVVVTPAASAPMVMIDTVPNGAPDSMVQLGATLAGGAYDEIDYAWSVGAGALDDDTAAAPTWTRPNADGAADIGLSITVRGTGTNALDGTSDAASAPTVTTMVITPPPAGFDLVGVHGDAAGGAVTASANVSIDGARIIVRGDAVASHAPCPIPASHCAATMADSAPEISIDGIRIQLTGSPASCAHTLVGTSGVGVG